MNRIKMLLASLAFPLLTFAQQECPELKEGAIQRIKEDISYLASDQLRGRKPGEEGAQMAAAYIKKAFAEMELESITKEAYVQNFSIPDKVGFGEKNKLSVGGKAYPIRQVWFPAQWSANGGAEGKTVYVKYGITAPPLGYNDYESFRERKLKDKIFVMDISSPDGIHPHSEYLKYHDLGERIEKAKEKGAKAVILVNQTGSANDVSSKFNSIRNAGIPVVFVSDSELTEKLKNKAEVSIATELSEKRIETSNIIGYLNNKAEKTIIIGAHYDHLGMGVEGSLYAEEEPAIHNGADDNASGVAGMLELTRNISADPEKYGQNNYLFAAFGAEESGLLGSSYFTDHLDEITFGDPKFMINLDMIGRLEDNLLAINGIGTSPIWPEIIDEEACGLRIKTSESGVGPSDHTNFYYKKIPAIHFFTGTHKDYHKPSDDYDKVNYEGEVKVISYILSLLEDASDFEDFEFTETKAQTQQAPRFSVTLGVMPDYMFEGEGMRIDGVTEGKPASEAGLKAGDVVVHLGDVKVVDMMSYMKALGQFKKGDEAELKYKRDGKTFTTKVKF